MRFKPIALTAASALALVGGGLGGAGLAVRAQTPAPPVFVWPVACKVGTSCEIQHYIDHDPTPGVKDFACGTRTYDKHDGVDIRLLDMAAERRGVAVLAAADGKVLRARDGVADVSVAAAGPGSVQNTECGNGLVVAHAGGFETQYCHMAKGSLIVKAGDMVKAGQPLGKVGLSGLTEFPHLHFTTRENGRVIDPFAYGAAEGTCKAGRSLFRDSPAYQARVVLNAGFAPTTLTMAAVEDGQIARPDAGAPVLVVYARAIGLKTGDVQSLTVKAPDGSTFVQNSADPLPRNSAQRLMFAGRKRPATGWAKGRYSAVYTVSAGGKVVLSKTFDLTL